MLISLNELKKLVDIKISDDELFKLIGSRLVEIEGVEDLAPKYKKIYVVKVLEATDIEGTHLHLCKIDAGKISNAEVDPKHDGFVQVVCGAPNVHAGMLAAWIAPGAIVPTTFGTSEPFEISARKLRGFESFGMLAAADELGLGSDHEGIIELDPKSANPGDLLADVLDLNDKIIEVENKSLTHRPDCFGLFGFAREVAGILGEKFVEPELLKAACPKKPGNISIESPEICPCYTYSIINLENPLEKEPFFDKNSAFLAKSGMHSISRIVDVTYLYMLMTGQPLHAFDYDKFLAVGGSSEPKIGVRLARADESLTLLDEKTIKLLPSDILITSNGVPVALAGAMGGESTMIDASTKRVILESATFSLYNLRKTQMAHGIFSEAITRFTKGQPASNCEPVLLAATNDILSSSASAKAEFFATEYSRPLSEIKVSVSLSEINSLLGSSYSLELVSKTLENTGFIVKALDDNNLEVFAPAWRTDIHIKEDIIEEVGRLLGYDNLPLNFPHRPFVCSSLDPMLKLKSDIRTILSDRLGANELLTYSFVSKALQEKVNEDVEDSYRITNSISPELEVFRQSLVPSLLDKIRENEKAGFKDFMLYELNQVSKKSFGLTDENVPLMKTELGLVTFGDFFRAKGILLELEKSLGFKFILKPIDSAAFFEPVHSAKIFLETESGEIEVGTLGEVKSSVLKRFKLSEICSALQLTLDPCLDAKKVKKSSVKLSRFPFVSRDLTVRVKSDESYEKIESEISRVLTEIEDLIFVIEPVSIYRKGTETTKNLSFHLRLTNSEKTFESKEVSDIIEKITNVLTALGAEVV